MAFDGGPWAVENGAYTSAAAARAAHYAATNGEQGITRPGDLKVTPTPTASKAVRIATGSATLLNQQAPGESYQGLARSFTDVPISVNGASRNDLIIAQIIDPDFPPWQESDVPDPVNGPYFKPHVLQGVSASTTKATDVVPQYSALALARIAVPASGNITGGITDLRALAQPHSWARNFGGPPASQVNYVPGMADGGDPFTMATFSNVNPDVYIPAWATHHDVVASAIGVRTDGALNNGAALVRLGPQAGGLYGPHINYDFSDQNVTTGEWNLQTLAAVNIGAPVPSALRGTTQKVTMRVRVDIGNLQLQTWSVIAFQVAFYELIA